MNLVFDFGAVLFRWQPELLMQAHFAERAINAQATRELVRALFHHPDWQSFDRGAIAERDLVRRTSQRLGLQPAAVAALLEGIESHLTPIESTVALLERLTQRARDPADVRLFYLSNMPVRFARLLERRHDLASWFEGAFSPQTCTWPSPSPASTNCCGSVMRWTPRRRSSSTTCRPMWTRRRRWDGGASASSLRRSWRVI